MKYKAAPIPVVLNSRYCAYITKENWYRTGIPSFDTSTTLSVHLKRRQLDYVSSLVSLYLICGCIFWRWCYICTVGMPPCIAAGAGHPTARKMIPATGPKNKTSNPHAALGHLKAFIQG